MAKIIVSFLGVLNYTQLKYSLDDQERNTPFVAAALTSILNVDEIRILATKKAQEKNAAALQEALRNLNIRHSLKFYDLPDGATIGEQREQLRMFLDTLKAESNDSLIIDITHGWRAQPFLAATAIATLQAAGDLPADTRILYAAAPSPPQEGDPAPIWDLTGFMQQLQQAFGLIVFRDTGHADLLVRALRDEEHHLRQRKQAGEREEFPSTGKLIGALDRLARHLAQLRVPQITIGDGRPSSAQQLVDALNDYANACQQDHPALVPLLDDLRKMIAPLACDTLADEQGHRALLHLAQLYRQFNRLVEAAALAREGIVCLYADDGAATDAGRPTFDDTARQNAERNASWHQQNRGHFNVRNDLLHCGFKKSPAGNLDTAVKELIKAFAEQIEEGPLTEQNKQAKLGQVLFVTRHKGAVEWVRRQGIIAKMIDHLDEETIAGLQSGDMVMGVLPVSVVAEVMAQGARFLHLELQVPPELRGKELSADDLERMGAKLVEYEVRKVDK